MQALYQKVRDAAIDGPSEAVTPSPDVTGAECELTLPLPITLTPTLPLPLPIILTRC